MHIPIEDFYTALEIANKAGQRGKEINLTYIPQTLATQSGGIFVVDEYTLSASGARESFGNTPF